MVIPVISFEKAGCYRLPNLLTNEIVTKEFSFFGRGPLNMACKLTISMGGLTRLFLSTGSAYHGSLGPLPLINYLSALRLHLSPSLNSGKFSNQVTEPLT